VKSCRICECIKLSFFNKQLPTYSRDLAFCDADKVVSFISYPECLYEILMIARDGHADFTSSCITIIGKSICKGNTLSPGKQECIFWLYRFWRENYRKLALITEEPILFTKARRKPWKFTIPLSSINPSGRHGPGQCRWTGWRSRFPVRDKGA